MFSFFVFTLIFWVIFVIFVLADLLVCISFGAKFLRWIARYSVLGLNAVRVVDDIVQLFVYFLDWFQTAFFVEVLGLFVGHSLKIRFLFPFINVAFKIILQAILDVLKIILWCLLIHEWWVEMINAREWCFGWQSLATRIVEVFIYYKLTYD